jgi:hypothetical protein
LAIYLPIYLCICAICGLCICAIYGPHQRRQRRRPRDQCRSPQHRDEWSDEPAARVGLAFVRMPSKELGAWRR